MGGQATMKIHAGSNLSLAMVLAIGLGPLSTVPARPHVEQIWFEASVPQGRNTIAGTVYGESHRQSPTYI